MSEVRVTEQLVKLPCQILWDSYRASTVWIARGKVEMLPTRMSIIWTVVPLSISKTKHSTTLFQIKSDHMCLLTISELKKKNSRKLMKSKLEDWMVLQFLWKIKNSGSLNLRTEKGIKFPGWKRCRLLELALRKISTTLTQCNLTWLECRLSEPKIKKNLIRLTKSCCKFRKKRKTS